MSAWSACRYPCGTDPSNYRSRSVQCVLAAAYAGTATVVDHDACTSRGLPTPAVVDMCSAVECEGLFWQTGKDWSVCSAPCTGGNAYSGLPGQASLGVSTRRPPVCMLVGPDGTAQAVETTRCESEIGVRPRVCARGVRKSKETEVVPPMPVCVSCAHGADLVATASKPLAGTDWLQHHPALQSLPLPRHPCVMDGGAMDVLCTAGDACATL